MKMTDFARVFQPIPLRLNYRLISAIRYLQRLFIHKKITPARLACLCFSEMQIQHTNSATWPREHEAPVSKRRPYQKQFNGGKGEQDSFDTHIPSSEHSSITNPAWQFQSDCRRSRLIFPQRPMVAFRRDDNLRTSLVHTAEKQATTHAGTYPCQHPTLPSLWPYFQRNRSSGAKGSLHHQRFLQ